MVKDWRRVKRAAKRAEREYAVQGYLIAFIALAALLASLWA
jgi:hypothetical protein